MAVDSNGLCESDCETNLNHCENVPTGKFHNANGNTFTINYCENDCETYLIIVKMIEKMIVKLAFPGLQCTRSYIFFCNHQLIGYDLKS